MEKYYLKWLSGFFGGVAIGLLLGGAAFAADLPVDGLKFAPGVTKSTEGYETLAATYVVANPTISISIRRSPAN